MKKQQALLFVNGEPPEHYPIDLQNYQYIACTDGAYHNYLSQTAIIPDFIIGDLDSFDAKGSVPCTTQIIHTPDQNKTDFEKAILFLADNGITTFTVYGAAGRSSDHFLGNLSVALQYHQQFNITFYDNSCHFFFAKSGQTIHKVKDRIISLLPFCQATGVSVTGVAYPLINQNLTFGGLVSVRNKAISDVVEVVIETGTLLIFIENFYLSN